MQDYPTQWDRLIPRFTRYYNLFNYLKPTDLLTINHIQAISKNSLTKFQRLHDANRQRGLKSVIKAKRIKKKVYWRPLETAIP